MRSGAMDLIREAKSGDQDALSNLAMRHLLGEGVPRNADLAIGMFSKAAEQGNPYALYNLGVILYEGKLMEQDKESAFKMIRQAANKGLPVAVEALKTLEGTE